MPAKNTHPTKKLFKFTGALISPRRIQTTPVLIRKILTKSHRGYENTHSYDRCCWLGCLSHLAFYTRGVKLLTGGDWVCFHQMNTEGTTPGVPKKPQLWSMLTYMGVCHNIHFHTRDGKFLTGSVRVSYHQKILTESHQDFEKTHSSDRSWLGYFSAYKF